MSIKSLASTLLTDATHVTTSVVLTLMLSQFKEGTAKVLRWFESETGTGGRGEQLWARTNTG